MGRKLSAYNLHMKRELKGKLSGKTKAQRKAIFKAAARKWKGKGKTASRSKPKNRASPSRRAKPKGVRRNMTKNTFNMNKIYSLANKAAFFAPYVGLALDPGITPARKVNFGISFLTGYNMDTGVWSFESLKRGWLPYVATKLTTAVVPKIASFVKGLLS